MLRPRYKFRNLRKRLKLKYYTVRPDTKYFFSFHNEWLDSRLEIFWDYVNWAFRHRWSTEIVYSQKLPIFDEKKSFFLVDPLYSEDPFDSSKVFVDSVPFDDEEFGEDIYEGENYFFGDDFDLDDFFLENLFLFVFLMFIFFPILFPILLLISIFFIITVYEEFILYDEVTYEHEDWVLIDDAEEEDDVEFFLETTMFADDDEADLEYDVSTNFYFFAEFVFLDFFTFDEFFILGRPWAHKPFYMKFLKVFKIN